MNSRVKRTQHVVLSTDRPPPTDPRGIFADFRGSVNGKMFERKQASVENTAKLIQRHEAMSLLGEHAKANEMEQVRSAQSSTYRMMNKISSAIPSYFTDTVEDRTPFIGSNTPKRTLASLRLCCLLIQITGICAPLPTIGGSVLSRRYRTPFK